jgi:hypothetical protein
VSETIKVSKETKRSLLKVAAKLRASTRKRIDFDEAIQHLVSLSDKRPDLLDRVFGSVPRLTLEDMRKERESDELRAKRKYSL